jgi:hypothetical protein
MRDYEANQSFRHPNLGLPTTNCGEVDIHFYKSEAKANRKV